MSRLLAALASGRVLLMDGAMGTELQHAGLPEGECGATWNVTHPTRVLAIHQAQVNAGAECLLTNTFQANPPTLARHDAQEHMHQIHQAALALARSAAGPERFVLADVGPILARLETYHLGEIMDWDTFATVVGSLTAAGIADGLLLETFSTPQALQAVRYCREHLAGLDSLPILLSLTYRRMPNGSLQTFSGDPPEFFAHQARASGVALLGVNCGRDIGMEEMSEIIRRYRHVTDLPLFARPNAGTPGRVGDRWVYPHTPEMMAERLPELLEAGINMVGGCCGTTPEHLAAFRPILEAWTPKDGPRETRP